MNREALNSHEELPECIAQSSSRLSQLKCICSLKSLITFPQHPHRRWIWFWLRSETCGGALISSTVFNGVKILIYKLLIYSWNPRRRPHIPINSWGGSGRSGRELDGKRKKWVQKCFCSRSLRGNVTVRAFRCLKTQRQQGKTSAKGWEGQCSTFQSERSQFLMFWGGFRCTNPGVWKKTSPTPAPLIKEGGVAFH